VYKSTFGKGGAKSFVLFFKREVEPKVLFSFLKERWSQNELTWNKSIFGRHKSVIRCSGEKKDGFCFAETS
jgi:hypothetical protein